MKYICTRCGSLLEYRGSEPVSFFEVFMKILFSIFVIATLCCMDKIGIVLFILWVIDLIYGRNHCKKCKCYNSVIPIDSPGGKILYKKYTNDLTSGE